MTPLMSGAFISRDIYPNARAVHKAYSAVWYDPSEDSGDINHLTFDHALMRISTPVAGHTISFSTLVGGTGLRLSHEGLTLDLSLALAPITAPKTQ